MKVPLLPPLLEDDEPEELEDAPLLLPPEVEPELEPVATLELAPPLVELTLLDLEVELVVELLPPLEVEPPEEPEEPLEEDSANPLELLLTPPVLPEELLPAELVPPSPAVAPPQAAQNAASIAARPKRRDRPMRLILAYLSLYM
jgi:hypothetical protein